MRVFVPSCKPGREEAIVRALFTNPRTRTSQQQEDFATACAVLAKYSQQYGDLVTGNRPLTQDDVPQMDFSQPSRFPTNDPARPAALFQTAQRMMVDISWTTLFDVQDFRSSNEEGFDIADVYDAVTFNVVPDGVPIRVAGVSGSETNYKFQDVGGGFEYSINWEADNKFWRMANGLAAMNARYAHKQSQLAWSVACASGLSTTARVTAPSTTVGDDIATINSGMDEIINAIYTDTDADGNATDEWSGEPTFVIAYNNTTAGYRARAQHIAASFYTAANDVTGGQQLAYPAVFAGNPYVTTGNFYLFLPKRKFVAGVRQDLRVYEDFDPYKRVKAHPGYGRYRVVRGDTNQGRIIPLS